MMIRFQRSHQQGISLIEVLIAVLIFSVGLLGIAGLLVVATKANHNAYMRTQVTYLAQNMADRMSANPIAVWNGNYDSAGYPLSVSQSCATGCTPANLAVHDQGLWSRQLQTFLPNPTATISCNDSAAGYDPTNLGMRPPYGGSCTMTVTWSERGGGGVNERDAQNQSFAWVFQP